MNKMQAFFLLACVTLLSDGARAYTQDDIEAPISFNRLNEKTLIVKAGDVYPDQIVAIAAQKGLVVIDTGVSPTLSREYRKIIERELGRDDFAWVVNTHHHFDHTNGNQVFSDAVIVGHDRGPEAMRRFEEGIADFMPARQKRYTRRADLLRGVDPSSKMAGRLRDLVYTL
jgi:glyoxylase-like metal-dependent hydrolase (beta-lactamase superfamily II)